MNLMSFLYQLESFTLYLGVGAIEQAPLLSGDENISTLEMNLILAYDMSLIVTLSLTAIFRCRKVLDI